MYTLINLFAVGAAAREHTPVQPTAFRVTMNPMRGVPLWRRVVSKANVPSLRRVLFPAAAVSLSFAVALASACGPKRGAVEPVSGDPSATASAPTATATSTTTATAAPTTTGAPSTTATSTAYPLPTIGIPGLPASPRAALIGKWTVNAIDGKPISTAPGMATNPLDPTSYAAGSTITFTADAVTFARAGVPFMQRAYKVIGELPPVRVSIDAGFGASNVDFVIDGSAIWSLPSTPPHALSLVRSP